MKKILYLLLFSLGLVSVSAQSTTISGSIEDENGLPIQGAYVLLQGTKNGAVSDENGNFQYTMNSQSLNNAIVEVSAMGYKTITQKVGKKRIFHFLLAESPIELEELVVTSSYGTQKMKEEVVGSIVSVEAEDIQVEQAFESVDKMLDGVVPGVSVETSTTVGGAISINIRGQGTLSLLGNTLYGTSTQPLIIVDGVYLTEEAGFDDEMFDGTGGFSEEFLNPLSKIAPEDIANISVLKDAAAVGLYGADAANGVILITTKKGRKGKAKYRFSAQTGVSTAINRIKYLSGEQYNTLRNEVLVDNGQSAVAYNGVDTDWFDLLNKNGYFNRYNFSVSGGDRLNYRVSFNHLNNNEPQRYNDYKTYSTALNLSYNQDKWDMVLNLRPSYSIKNQPNSLYAFALYPTLAPYDENGNFTSTGTEGIANPLAAATQNQTEIKTFGLVSSLNTTYRITNNIRLNALLGVDYAHKNQDLWYSGDNESGRRSGTFVYQGITYDNWGRRSIRKRKTFSWNMSANAYYEKQWNDTHFFDALVGVEIRKQKINNNRSHGVGFVDYGQIQDPYNAYLQRDDPENDNNYSYNTYTSDSRTRSLFSQLNYNYKKKYFLLANIRRDESSAFGGDKDVAFNGGVGASWVISQEKFLEKSQWLNFLRWRVSYGVTGNSRIGSYRSAGLYSVDVNDYDGYNQNIDATPYTIENDNLGWESNYKFNTGVDFNFLNKFRFTVEFFREDIKDMIVSRDIPSDTGYNTVQINGAEMYNQGVDLAISADIVNRENFRWNSSFNISTLKNKVTDLKTVGSDYSSTNLYAQRIGYSTSALWGFEYGGVDPATGNNLYIVNGEVYDQAYFYENFAGNPEYYSVIGNTQPKFYGGFTNRFNIYKNLSLQFKFTYKWDYDALVENELVDYYRITFNRNLSVNALDRWQQPGDITIYPRASNDTGTYSRTSKYVYDASYIKLQNINIAYRLNLKKENMFLDYLNFSLDVTNVFYWYKEKSPAGRNGYREFRFTYPEARTYTIGVSANF